MCTEMNWRVAIPEAGMDGRSRPNIVLKPSAVAAHTQG